MNKSARIFLAGHRGLVGSAFARRLARDGFTDVITRTRAELDLTDGAAVGEFFTAQRPAYVILAAAKVGGILANSTYPADFIRENLQIELNVIDAAYRAGSEKLLYLGSSCIYPKHAPQPMKEEHLLTGPLEPTNAAYAVAKIAGIEMCHAYRQQYGFRSICVMPTNLYGPGDNFDLQSSHVLPALLRKFHEAKRDAAPSVTIWGSGSPRREFLAADDLVDACMFLLEHREHEPLINIGCGEDIAISELAALIADVVGYGGELVYDRSKPDGTPRKLLDISRLRALGWQPAISLHDGLQATYRWYLEHQPSAG